MKKLLSISLMTLLSGCCAYVIVDKRPNIALPVYQEGTTNTVIRNYIVVDQGYSVKYYKRGFNTEIQSMSAELTTNKTVKFSLGGLTSNIATNSINIRVDDIIKLMSMFRSTTNDVIVIERGKY